MALKDLELRERNIIDAFLKDVMKIARTSKIEIEIMGDGMTDYKGTFERSVVDANIGNCSETTICIRRDNARGNVLFVHGLGEDVIANIGGNTEGYDMMHVLLENADRLAQELV